jgi:hypothetical protein
VSTVTITHAPPEIQQVEQTTESAGGWDVVEVPDQQVVSFGTLADAAEGGRLAVREHADALRSLRDS